LIDCKGLAQCLLGWEVILLKNQVSVREKKVKGGRRVKLKGKRSGKGIELGLSYLREAFGRQIEGKKKRRPKTGKVGSDRSTRTEVAFSYRVCKESLLEKGGWTDRADGKRGLE